MVNGGKRLKVKGGRLKAEGGRLKVRDAGFTYISVLILVVIAGIALTGASRYWSTAAKREKEAELFFRGDQIKKAIELYYNSALGEQQKYPRTLKNLLKDNRHQIFKRHLRKIYQDPMTKNGEWKKILDSDGAIKGVCSKSTAKPLKRGGFTKEYKNFEDSEEYSDWKFVYPFKTMKGKDE